MRERPQEEPGAVLSSERVYRVLLVLYPKYFRREFGDEMASSFGDMCKEELQRSGRVGLFRLWFRTFLELLVTAAKERGHALNTTKLSRLGGSMALVGGGLLVAYAGIIIFYERLFVPTSPMSQALFNGSQIVVQVGMLLLAGGLLGIVSRIYSAGRVRGRGFVPQRPPVAGRLGPAQIFALAGLILAAVAAVSWAASLVLTLVNGPPLMPADSIADTLIPVLWTVGIWTLALSTVALGAVVWQTGILGRWSVLPVAVGAFMLLLLAFATVSLLVSGPRTLPGETLEVILYFVIPFTVLGLGWMLLGYALRLEDAGGNRGAAPVRS